MSFLDKFKKNKKGKKASLPEAKVEAVEKQTRKPLVKSLPVTELSFYKVLLRPLISEKAASAESRGIYSFIVNKQANKFQIKQAIAAHYHVQPLKVRVINLSGKWVRQGRSLGRRSDWKKAIVTLAPGQSISIHEGV